MNIGTVLRYLIGDRQAILDIAGNRHALWIGALFVLSAGFAREYDGEDLLHEPWHLALPFAASLGASLILFVVVYGVAMLKGAPARPFFQYYLSFLGLFWMMAPLAWLYAIPYERFLGPRPAATINLLTLGLVSAWRVVLMVRVLLVVTSYRPLALVGMVMIFADAVALLLLNFLPAPLLELMGGTRLLTENERIVQDTGAAVFCLGWVTYPIWIVLFIVGLLRSKPRWQVVPAEGERSNLPGRGLTAVAVASVVLWAVVLPFTQPEQQRRHRVERAYEEGRMADLVAELSAHERSDYPPHWEPPPRRLHSRSGPDNAKLLDIWDEIVKTDPPAWVREVYLQRLRAFLRSVRDVSIGLPRVESLVRRLPEGPELLAETGREGRSPPFKPRPKKQ
jgi:hypothetical protein